MAMTRLSGASKFWYPFDMRWLGGSSTFLNIPGSDGVVTRMGFGGRVWFPARSGSKTITKLGFSSSLTEGSIGDIIYSDLVIDATESDKVSSAANPFNSSHIGFTLEITGGAGFTPGDYVILNVVSGVALLIASAGAVGSSGGTGVMQTKFDPTLHISLDSTTATNLLMLILLPEDFGTAFDWTTGDELEVSYNEPLFVNFDWIGNPSEWRGGQARISAYQPAPIGFGSMLPFVAYDEAEGNYKANCMIPNLVLGFSDDTYGILDGSAPAFDVSTLTFGPGDDPDEYGLQFQIPWDCKVDALCMYGSTRGNSETRTTSLLLYQDQIPIGEREIDEAETPASSTEGLLILPLDEEKTITRDVDTIISVRPNNVAEDVFLSRFSVASSYRALMGGDPSMGQVSKGSSDVWSSVSPFFLPRVGMRISSINTAALPPGTAKEWLRYFRLYSGGAA